MILLTYWPTRSRMLMVFSHANRETDHAANALLHIADGGATRDLTGLFEIPPTTIQDERLPATLAEFDTLYPGRAYAPPPET